MAQASSGVIRNIFFLSRFMDVYSDRQRHCNDPRNMYCVLLLLTVLVSGLNQQAKIELTFFQVFFNIDISLSLQKLC